MTYIYIPNGRGMQGRCVPASAWAIGEKTTIRELSYESYERTSVRAYERMGWDRMEMEMGIGMEIAMEIPTLMPLPKWLSYLSAYRKCLSALGCPLAITFHRSRPSQNGKCSLSGCLPIAHFSRFSFHSCAFLYFFFLFSFFFFLFCRPRFHVPSIVRISFPFSLSSNFFFLFSFLFFFLKKKITEL